MSQFNIISAASESTVVAAYTPDACRSDSYQSEAALEQEFLRLLCAQGYEYLEIHDEAALIANLCRQLEGLNDYAFSDSEWTRFFKDCIAGANDGIWEKTRRIQLDHVQVLRQDSGASKNIYLLDKKHIHNNRLQVLHQYEETAGNHDTRYDVTVLVNGLPLVHIELKRRGVAIREAFNQIKRYQRDSFWADGNNKVIADLVDFTKTFFAKHTLLSILTRYCVFTSENLLLVMRPYQIVATERILNRIEVSTTYKQYGGMKAGGYIWHTTGAARRSRRSRPRSWRRSCRISTRCCSS